MSETPRGIDATRVTGWLEAHIAGVTPPLRFELITGGRSNLTFRVEDAKGRAYALRRPPLGAIVATAHDMAREHRIIAALGPTDVPVPAALALCEDEAVNDAPFYVMSFVEGVVLSGPGTVEKHFPREVRPTIARSLIEVLASLHQVDPDAVGLGDLGRKQDYLARQLRRWKGQWERTRTRELPLMDELHARLEKRKPQQHGATIVHGDYRCGNTITAADGHVAAVLDWELCTLGDPLADVGYLMNSWPSPDERSPMDAGASVAPTLAGGFPGRDELLTRYTELTGRDTSEVDYYRAFQYWRLAAIVEGVMARYIKGVMGDRTDVDALRTQIDGCAESAHDILRRMGA
jgi:aminoglycoside phosphotransferase (APT) family kinase protein